MMDKIRENLYLGSISDNKKFNGTKICVLEHDEWDRYKIDSETIVIPIIKTKGFTDRPWKYQNIINEINLNAVVDVAHTYISKNVPVLIHCEIGKERSPLAVMYYLHKYEGLTMIEAYEEVKRIRQKTENRLYWLNYDEKYLQEVKM
jgi:protein-tyrosine phosphatase